METLVVAQHRNQCYGRTKHQGPARFGSYPSRSFREINCRTFQAGAGILPTPSNSLFVSSTKRPLSSSPPASSTPLMITPLSACNAPPSDDLKSQEFQEPHSVGSKTSLKSTPIPIKTRPYKETNLKEELSGENLSFSELWAGPAYSNSPPPSSLPMPKFSLRPKRTVSLNLSCAGPDLEVEMHAMAKSAPSSPTRDHSICATDLFGTTASATKTLRRILNLDVTDD